MIYVIGVADSADELLVAEGPTSEQVQCLREYEAQQRHAFAYVIRWEERGLLRAGDVAQRRADTEAEWLDDDERVEVMCAGCDDEPATVDGLCAECWAECPTCGGSGQRRRAH